MCILQVRSSRDYVRTNLVEISHEYKNIIPRKYENRNPLRILSDPDTWQIARFMVRSLNLHKEWVFKKDTQGYYPFKKRNNLYAKLYT